MRVDLDATEPPQVSEAAEATASFVLGLRAHGVRDLAVLRAMEAVPRAAFAPPRHAALATRDIALPIPCGQTMSEPAFLARLLAALDCSPWSRVLEVGTGSGYSTALLARLAGEVVSVDRFARLVVDARAHLAALGVQNATLEWADGLGDLPVDGQFDRIVVHAALDAAPVKLLDRLAPEGMLIYPALAPDRPASQGLMCWTRIEDELTGRALAIPSRLQQARLGRSGVL